MTGGGRTGKVIKLECGSTIIIYKRDGLSRQKTIKRGANMEKDQSTDKARVVAYLRTASGREGITKQRKEIEEFAEKAGITIDEFLELEAVRAEKGIIELFRRLHPNDRLIITDFSRLTRKLTDLPEIINKLKSNEIHVTSLKMGGAVDAVFPKSSSSCTSPPVLHTCTSHLTKQDKCCR